MYSAAWLQPVFYRHLLKKSTQSLSKPSHCLLQLLERKAAFCMFREAGDASTGSMYPEFTVVQIPLCSM